MKFYICEILTENIALKPFSLYYAFDLYLLRSLDFYLTQKLIHFRRNASTWSKKLTF